ASHQLRTPLTALRLRLENLESAPGAATDELASAIAEADRLSHVVEELLVLARTDGSRPERAVIDLTPLVEDRLDAWQPLARDHGVSLRWDDATARDARGWRAVACPGHVEQILDNLLANALNATGPGGTVSVAIDRSHDDVEVRVRDTGHGMRAEERLRAFDRFWRSDTSIAGGTGLGLAIVAQLVRASGGTCWLDASPTGGIDAVVRLPVPR
ncbi:MAG TPA: HAMP domain-containing sensor histidine kinase, partial [Acidimicrobiales bacterium]|nr:HAMP domain-containing sensor histidine kinase [Acidimicrobiales bacterium]